MTAHPIIDAALDDRLAFVGNSGSGKTYNAGTAIERLLTSGARSVIVDPLGVWWGLRVRADGKGASPFPVVIFGGPHADLPLTENAGALIGEAAAGMAESCIIDLSEICTAAGERRFMLAFLRTLYRNQQGALVHLVLDEADMWAPQTIRDKDGDANKLFAMVERIVRRGRVDGFIPWQITQRPAELSKSVLSMAEGMVAMRLTSPQDRNALDAWISGQADLEEGKRIKAELPKLTTGQGVVWLPKHGVLEQRTFPRKATFDSSRAPKRGEARPDVKLKPLDVGALREKLAAVEAETKANDPRALRAEIERLKREATATAKAAPAIDTEYIRVKGFEEGHASGYAQGHDAGVAEGFNQCLELVKATVLAVERKSVPAVPAREARPTPAPQPPTPVATPTPKPLPKITALNGADVLSRSQLKVLEAIAFFNALGFDQPTRAQIGAASGYSPTGGGLGNLLGALRTAGYVEYPAPNCASLTDKGRTAAPSIDMTIPVRERLANILSNPQAKIIDALPRDGSPMSREDLGAATEYSPTGGGLGNLCGSLRTLGFVTYPQAGFVAVEQWVWR
jgi:uncharacterized protein